MKEFSFAGGRLLLGEKTYLMGILNITPDSFYDGGRYNDPEKALRKAVSLMEEGADILDVGALSTRPGAVRAAPQEELLRLKQILPILRREIHIPISVDTYRPEIARFCLENGANIINDVSGVFSAEMAAAVKVYGAGWIVMHAGAPGEKTEAEISYPEGIIRHVGRFFSEITEQCLAAGIPSNKICMDPGFGFAKNVPQNIELLNRLSLLKNGTAMLVGLSRKRFVRALAKGDSSEQVLQTTLLLDRTAADAGADILRVHDVKAHREMLGYRK